jgi:3-phenylpropionate/trans-cinnamate dioxygenase ferredoxin reductase subunit
VSAVEAIVIAGAGLAGASAAVALRDEGFDGRIQLVGDEPHAPYERPPLSKSYLRGETDAEDAQFLPTSWFEHHDVELVAGTRVTGIDARGRRVELDDGRALRFDRALVATGGRPRRLTVAGADLEGIRYLRTLEDADRIRSAAPAGARAVVVGAGFIGCEVAASLRTLGLDVEVVEPFAAPLLGAVGPEVGRVIEDVHREHGVRFHLGESVARFEGADGRVAAVVTDHGTQIEGDLVVVGVGIVPNVEAVAGTDITVRDGIVVDARCRTAVEAVYAAGDVANHDHPLFGPLRVEHWDNAIKQGAAAARGMLGRDEPFDDPHWFWSDQYDHELQMVGWAPNWEELVIRGSLRERRFLGFYLVDRVPRAVVGLDRGREVRRAARLVAAGRPVDPDVLRDEGSDLAAVAAGGR